MHNLDTSTQVITLCSAWIVRCIHAGLRRHGNAARSRQAYAQVDAEYCAGLLAGGHFLCNFTGASDNEMEKRR